MSQAAIKLQIQLTRDYYKFFSKYTKGKPIDKKVAWVTSFTPVEILEALDIAYYYPESYAAVIAASSKEQKFLEEAINQNLCKDCCSYSCCIEGCVQLEEGPRGLPPKPNVLIATNNQCDTLPNWWNILAKRYDIPLIIIDYPGEYAQRDIAFEYVSNQHKELITKMELLSGNKLDYKLLNNLIDNSNNSISAWNNVISLLKKKQIKPTLLFDDLSYLITSRCKPNIAEFYSALASELNEKPDYDGDAIPLFWLGYPLWYHTDRYLTEILDGFRIVGSNYITWWNLDYSGKDVFEKLFNAYNYTFLNLSQKSRNQKLNDIVNESGAKSAVVLHNKSCKCDFVSARDINIPKVELEIDMVDRTFLNIDNARNKVNLLKEILCTK